VTVTLPLSFTFVIVVLLSAAPAVKCCPNESSTLAEVLVLPSSLTVIPLAAGVVVLPSGFVMTVIVVPSSFVVVSVNVPSAAVVVTVFPSALITIVVPPTSVAVVLPLVCFTALVVWADMHLWVLQLRDSSREGQTSPPNALLAMTLRLWV